MSSDLVKQSAEIVAAYVSNNEMPAAEVANLLQQVHAALQGLSAGAPLSIPAPAAPQAPVVAEPVSAPPSPPAAPQEPAKPTPKVPLDAAVTEDAVICLICGKPCKALKGHLTRSHKVDFDEYRAMFNLPKDFPMVAPSYSEKRRQLAIDAGLADKLQEARKAGKKKAAKDNAA